MEVQWWQVVIALLSSGTIGVWLKGRIDARAAARARKNQLEDRAMDKNDRTLTLEEQFNAFRAEQREENAEIRHRLGGLESSVGMMREASAWDTYVAIRKEALGYIKRGRADADDWAILRERFARYRKQTGDTTLDDIMSALDGVRLIGDGDN